MVVEDRGPPRAVTAVRSMVIADVPVVGAWAVSAGFPGYGEAALSGALSKPQTRAFSLVEEGRLRGAALFEVVAPEAELHIMVVSTGMRRRGYGRVLLEQAHRRLAMESVQSVFLEVAKDNHCALRLYERLAYQRVGRRTGYYGPGRDALVFRRDL